MLNLIMTYFTHNVCSRLNDSVAVPGFNEVPSMMCAH